jgi:thiol-disulfide isomerase/thioredoxin
VNLDGFQGRLGPAAPTSVAKPPALDGDLWYGEIFRQLPGDEVASRKHNVPFAVVFQGADVVRARADTNLNGDLSDDADAKISLYPGENPGRSFLAELRWAIRKAGAEVRIDRLVRVVVEPAAPGILERTYRTQEVYGMLGNVGVDGAPTLALLYDSNQDGLYTKGSGDGVFVDLDGDRHFPIDAMAPDFGPLAIPFALGRQTVVVDEIEPAGTRLTLRTVGPAIPTPAVDVGGAVPDVPYVDTDGRLVLLGAKREKPIVVYFWASWCDSCRASADELEALYKRYAPERLELLGVSYDSDRKQMERFRREHRQTWPTSFAGGVPAEDPVGRSFREGGTGVYYVIDASGRLAGKYLDVSEVNEKLMTLAPARSIQ